MSSQVESSTDEHCKVPCRIPALAAAQAEAYRNDIIEWGYNGSMCARTFGTASRQHTRALLVTCTCQQSIAAGSG